MAQLLALSLRTHVGCSHAPFAHFGAHAFVNAQTVWIENA